MGAVLDVVRRANQRGGRMLSVLDLVDAGTLSPRLAAWLLSRIADGSSWLVGARPGGAGKTTIMAALLAMLPEAEPVHLAVPGGGWRSARAGECVVAYEISPGAWEAYIWGEDLRAFAALGARGCRLVTNLHADTLAEAREQIVAGNGVPAADFDRLGLFLPISLDGSGPLRRPRLPAVWRERDGRWERVADPPPGEIREGVPGWLERALGEDGRAVEAVRASWLRFLAAVT